MKTEQAKLLSKLMDVDFVIHELVLFLDSHPEDRRALEFYKKAVAEQKEIYDQYVTRYGPIVAEDVRQDRWSWVDSPWPWQNEKEARN
ncbi:MAG: spore coat protein CotJB [Clostridiales bacterium]|jgi:spore coat protein JB|nr:spore coat protein CotJB [Clostridiales bacterium]